MQQQAALKVKIKSIQNFMTDSRSREYVKTIHKKDRTIHTCFHKGTIQRHLKKTVGSLHKHMYPLMIT